MKKTKKPSSGLEKYSILPSLIIHPKGFDSFIALPSISLEKHFDLSMLELRLLSHFTTPKDKKLVAKRLSKSLSMSSADISGILNKFVSDGLLVKENTKSDEIRSVEEQPPADEPRYRLSKYVTILDMDDRFSVISNSLIMERNIVTKDIVALLASFKDNAVTISSIAADSVFQRDSIKKIADYFISKEFLVEEHVDEEGRIRSRIMPFLPRTELGDSMSSQSRERYYHHCGALSAQNFDAAPLKTTRAKLKFLIIGGCFAVMLADCLERTCIQYELDVDNVTEWFDNIESIGERNADVIVLQFGTTWLLGPLWNEGFSLDDAERTQKLEHLLSTIEMRIQAVSKLVPQKLLLVQGLSSPALSPLGRAEFRNDMDFQRIVYEINSRIKSLVRNNPNAFYIDEERIVSNVGKMRLLDDVSVPYGHHAPIDFRVDNQVPGATREELFDVIEVQHIVRLLAEEYLAAYTIWSGRNKIKCVITDLDNTLWPGIVGEEGFSIVDSNAHESMMWGSYGGIHQALRILKNRGILLASCSRNNEDDVLGNWETLENHAKSEGASHILRRDDFILHKINWNRKSHNIMEIATSLGLANEAILFIDDNAADREDVRSSLPGINVIGDNIDHVRYLLLTDPRLETNFVTSESKRRTKMVAAQIKRDETRRNIPDEKEFLRSIDIRLTIRRANDVSDVPRIVELIQRTNQFNTTLERFNQEDIERFILGDNFSLYTLAVEDIFTPYGIVGVCIISFNEISTLIMSCRVIGLKAALPFLITTLKDYGKFPIEGRIVEGPRNHPCRNIYASAGFKEIAEGLYRISDSTELTSIDPDIYHITLIE